MRNLENSHQKETEGLGLKKRLFTKQLSNSQKTSERYLKRMPQWMLQEIIVLNSCTEEIRHQKDFLWRVVTS